ncbi:class C beta-lactamase-related serine hydrolase [Roseibium polysiphoniae]|uniref:Class C beta-lactamase-related serine hydrolase n=1 Tax=Roseibium polysiphoniae TaxID=2571221 RepID=A0A944CEY2_9HYPH|nr:serine hydrolase [Roseibium polysiphoniae]MBS8261317.1 class C beta-lactamase-related serine hydrolase [Roseibium polysiphoniae]
MKRKTALWVSGLIVIAALCLTYLFMTGENGLSRPSASERALDITRLSDEKTESLGWHSGRLDAALSHAATLSTDSFIIVTNDQMVGAFGNLEKPYATHSMRKSFLSALVGLHLGSGPEQIDLDATLQELKVSDIPGPLSAKQRQATVLNLLKSVSGINHPAAASGGIQADIDKRLGHRENEPGRIWAYNNWDYNALTTIFEDRTGLGIAEAFDKGIARPTGMEDFSVDAVSYILDADLSMHKAAAFRMSARDLVRLGQLYLHKGRTDNQQILPESWIDRAVEDFTETGNDGLRWAHGYLWWIPGPDTGLPEGSFWAWGLGNQALFVVPAWDTVIVHQSDTTEFLKRFLPMIEVDGMEGEAAIEQLMLSCRERGNRESEYCIEHRFTTRREFDELMALIARARI